MVVTTLCPNCEEDVDIDREIQQIIHGWHVKKWACRQCNHIVGISEGPSDDLAEFLSEELDYDGEDDYVSKL